MHPCLDEAEKIATKKLRLATLVSGVVASHLEYLAAFDLYQDVIESWSCLESSRKVLALESQEVARQGRNPCGIDDEAKNHHRRRRGGAHVGILEATCLIDIADMHSATIH